MYALQIIPSLYTKNRDELLEYCNTNGIQCRPIWHLNHKQRPYQNYQSYNIELVDFLVSTTINIPCSINLKEDNIDYIVGHLKCKRSW